MLGIARMTKPSYLDKKASRSLFSRLNLLKGRMRSSKIGRPDSFSL